MEGKLGKCIFKNNENIILESACSKFLKMLDQFSIIVKENGEGNNSSVLSYVY